MYSGGPEGAQRVGCLGGVLFGSAALWVLAVTFGVQGAGWLLGQILLLQGTPPPPFVWALVSWGNALLLLLPLIPLALFARAPRLRAAYQTWLAAAAFLGVLGLVRLLPESWTQPAALAQILLSLGCLGPLAALARSRGYRFEVHWRPLLPVLALLPPVIFPWLAIGALGSPLDSLLNLLAGLSLGLFAGVLLETLLRRPLAAHSSGAGWDLLFGGFVAGVALAVLGGGFGFGGSQLLLLAALPPLGFAVAAAARLLEPQPEAAGRGWLPTAALVGFAAAAPLMFVDPEELTLLLDLSDVPGWAARAAGLSILIAGALGLALGLLRHPAAWLRRPDLSIPSIVVAWVAALLVYFFVGQPGFYGDQIFVILRDQADVTPASSIADRGERTRYVYETLTRHAAVSQAPLRADLDRLRLGYRPYYLVNALEVKGGPLVRWYLSTRPEVDRVLDSPHLRPLPAPVSPGPGDEPAPVEPEWNITSLGADRVWDELGITGAGIVVGQSDSGVEGSHPALRDGYRGRQGQDAYNWLDPWNGTSSPTDPGGHGTFTLGLAVGRGALGVAPEAEWFACVNLARNVANPAYYLDCLQFMMAPHPQGGDPFTEGDPLRAAHVTNNSWGCPPFEGCDATTLAPAVNALRTAGIFVVTSAGNWGPQCGSVSDPPAIYPEAFTVGAVEETGDVWSFSSRGPVTVDGSGRIKPDLVAPGVEVLSSFPGGGYKRESGTSAAGPHVAGVVALMWSAQPKLIGDLQRTERILVETARPYTGRREGCFEGGTPNAAFGHGLVDAYAAVKAALEVQ